MPCHCVLVVKVGSGGVGDGTSGDRNSGGHADCHSLPDLYVIYYLIL